MRIGFDVQVVQQQAIGERLDDDEADSVAGNLDIACIGRREAFTKTLSSAHRIEPANALKAFAHGFDTQCNEGFKVFRLNGC
ncbi:hypothetical protein CU666_11335 [Pseudomonas syringae pv. actinidifoliorum]|nr:hypothetical protein [Pseudomonas syringae pv. actinidifoliorum]NAT58806.1 hypothetical protein [Pseudomonas syringae pv. actinidifoliorum]